MRYQLNLEVKLIEVPEPQPAPSMTVKLGDDPIAAMGAAVGTLINSPVFTPPTFYGAPAGLDFRKSVQLSVPDFIEATKVLRRFYALCEEIEVQHIRTEV